MKIQKLAAIDELTSPLFRIMSVHNGNDPLRRQVDNNICAFHIGSGFILSVAHNLRQEATVFKSMSETRFQAEITPHLTPTEAPIFDRWFPLDGPTQKRYINIIDQAEVPILVEILKRLNVDTRWVSMYHSGICKPYLLIQQRCNQFYENAVADGHFTPATKLLDTVSMRQSYLIETELIEAYYEDDIALYKIVNTNQSVIDLIPHFDIDDEVYDSSSHDYFCVQSAPSDLNPGRMINEANIEGLVNQFTTIPDRIGGNYNIQGLRYLIKGYFRFGSSGAPYVRFDSDENIFKVNAIQSEACPIQLMINNDKDGNFQWVNAIAAPLANVMERIGRITNPH
ncbi:MAG: hypothetical protein WBO10_02770 [Pyrinomonadaceae bacterium]